MAQTVSNILQPSLPIHLPSHFHFLLILFCPLKLFLIQISNDLQVFKCSHHFSALCFSGTTFHPFLIIPSSPSDFLVTSLLVYLQMLSSAWSPHLEPHLFSLPSPLTHGFSSLTSWLNFYISAKLSQPSPSQLFSTIEVHLLPLLSVYCLLNYCLSPPRGN